LGGVLHFGIFPEVPNENDFIDAFSCHEKAP
jgi:hypothetical protein